MTMPENSTMADAGYERELRDINEALLLSSIRLQEETEKAESAEAALRQKQDQLEKNQLMLETALAAGSVTTVTWDIVNDIMFADDRTAAIFGIELSRAQSMPVGSFLSVIHPNDRSRVEEQIARTVEKDEPYEIEYRVVKPSGELTWLYVRGKVVRDASGTPLRFACALIDITERKKNEEAKYLLASIIESSRDSIITIDFDQIITSWNSAAELEAIGKSLEMLLLPQDLAQIFHNVDDIRHGDTVDMFQTVRLRKDGKPIDLEVVMSPVKDRDDHVVGISTIVRDITERIRSAEALQFSEQRFRVAVDAMESLVWTNNACGEMVGEQTGWAKFTGQSYEEYQGYGWSTAVHPDDARPTVEAWQDAVRAGKTFVFEHRLRRHDGEWRVCSVRAVPVRIPSGEVIEWVGSHTDITDRKLSEEALRRSHDELEDRVVERTEELVVANRKATAEVRKRLKTEEQRVGILRRLTTAQEDERRHLARELHDQIGQQITALRYKLEELRVARPNDEVLLEKIGQAQVYAKQIDADAGFLAYELRPAGLESLGLRAAVRDFVQQWSLNHDIRATFHAAETERRPLGSEVNIHVYRIVQEALNNTLKHAHAKQVTVILSFRDDILNLVIEDDGIGFDPSAKKTVGSPEGGFGLIGLRERCELIGGTMAIESAPKKGTAIFCRIPVVFNAASPD